MTGPRESGHLDAFVGRDAELRVLTQALDRVAGGEPAAALVAGEAGIGKSRLVDALVVVARRRGLRIVRGQAVDHEASPLALWGDVERALGTPTGRNDLVDRSLPASERRWELVDLLGVELAEAAPLVVVLEDLHWADEGSLWVLERLLRDLPERTMVVGTVRREEPGAPDLDGVRRQATVVELGGLDVQAVSRLVEALAPRHRVADPADLVARTGGNPLFLRELLALESQGDRLPPVVSTVLQRSLARLPEDAQEAVVALAVAGPDVPLAVLAGALRTSAEEALGRLEQAAEMDVVRLEAAGRARFRHALLADAAVSLRRSAERRSLHATLAEAWIQVDESPAGQAHAAHHRLAALPLGDPAAAGTAALDAVGALRRAGDDGRAVALAAEAGRALEASGGLVELRARLGVEHAQALHALGEETRSQQAFEQVADLARPLDDPELRAVAEVGASEHANPFMPHVDRLARLADVEQRLPAGDSALRAAVLGRMCVLHCSVPDGIEAAHGHGDAAVAMARRLDDPDLLVKVLANRHFIPLGVAGLDAKAAAADEIVGLGEQLRRPDIALQGHEWRFGDRLDRCDRVGAGAALDDLEAYAQIMPSPRWRLAALLRRASLHVLDSHRESALAAVDEATRLGAEIAYGSEIQGLELALRTVVALLWGYPDPALGPLYEQAVEATDAWPVPFFQVTVAVTSLAMGDLDRVRVVVDRYAGRPEPLLRGVEGAAVATLLGGLTAEAGAVEHAAALTSVLAPLRHRLGVGSGIAFALPVSTVLGQLATLEGDHAAAVDHHARAVAQVSALGSPSLLARSSLHLAQARSSTGDQPGAAAALAEARGIADRFGIRLPGVEVGAGRAAASGAPGVASLRRVDDGWRIESPYGTVTVGESLGVTQLATLLGAGAGAEVAATELAGMDASPVPANRDLGAALDVRAKREYRRRIGELQSDIDEAESNNDPDRAALARIELEALVAELRRAVGLDGRDRPSGSGAERARVNVTRSLKRVIAAVAEQAPGLGAHLERSVRTGRFCSYSPEPAAQLTWTIHR